MSSNVLDERASFGGIMEGGRNGFSASKLSRFNCGNNLSSGIGLPMADPKPNCQNDTKK